MSYTITLSDPNKTKTYTVEDNGMNTETSVTLIGSNAENYGTAFWENLLHLLENFCSDKEPVNALEGQLWYNRSTKSLNVYETDGKINFWSPVLKEASIDLLNYIDTSAPSTAVELRIPFETGSTVYSGPLKNDTNACTKKFADNWHGGVVTGSNKICNWVLYPNKFVIINGSGIGLVKLPFNMKDTNYSVVTSNEDNWTHSCVTNKTTSQFNTSGNTWMVVGMAL
jgi:hypothetical protein